MKVTVESSRLIKPSAHMKSDAHPRTIPLTVFDAITFPCYFPYVYVYRPPVPPNSHLTRGLADVLSVFREFAGRFGKDADGRPAIRVSDNGARLVEASVESSLDANLPLELTDIPCLRLCPDEVDELLLIQLTRFSCGALAVGCTIHHQFGDARTTTNFLVSWGRTCRGLAIIAPPPFIDRAALFAPRDPPRILFDHRSTEFKSEKSRPPTVKGEFAVHQFRFAAEFLAELKAEASKGADRPYTTFESLVGHVWRALTRARGIDGEAATEVRLSVDGRRRMRPRVPSEYCGNLILWAVPRAKAGELVSRPLQHAAGLVHEAIERVEDEYFRSFIDFASSGAVEEEELVPLASALGKVAWPNMGVDSWLRLPFYEMSFGVGGGPPVLFMPSHTPVEGLLFLLPYLGDGSIEAYLGLFHGDVDSFKQLCYTLEFSHSKPSG